MNNRLNLLDDLAQASLLLPNFLGLRLFDEWLHLAVTSALATTTTFAMEEVVNVRNIHDFMAFAPRGCYAKLNNISLREKLEKTICSQIVCSFGLKPSASITAVGTLSWQIETFWAMVPPPPLCSKQRVRLARWVGTNT